MNTLYKLIAAPITRLVNTQALQKLEKYIRKNEKSWFLYKNQNKNPLLDAMKAYLKYIQKPSILDIIIFFQTVFKDLEPEQQLTLLSRDLMGNDVTERKEHVLGDRLSLYADWTASGRALGCIEMAMEKLLPFHANSHTEDVEFGNDMTTRLHEADMVILDSINAPAHHYFPLTTGTGSSGPAFIIQNILGISLSSQAKSLVLRNYQSIARPEGPLTFEDYKKALGKDLPTVIVSPLEHHTSINPYRDGLSDLKMCELDSSGKVDYDNLEEQIRNELNSKNTVIVSLSAGSNVSGVLLDLNKVKEMISRIKSENKDKKLILGIDFAAVHAYQDIDLSDETIDFAIFSPHKLMGGVSTSGVGVFNRQLYNELCPLPASGGGGGTVEYVGNETKVHTTDETSRERSGTPGVFQNMRAALAMKLKQIVDPAIEAAEVKHVEHVFNRHETDATLRDCVEMVQLPVSAKGTPQPAASDRVGIFSYLVKMNIAGDLISDISEGPALVSPSLVATILDDFARIMTRAGCSCAGPYGHYIFGVAPEKEPRFAAWVTEQGEHPGFPGFKPGWERWNAHPTMTTAEVDYFLDMFKTVVKDISKLMPLYDWNPQSGKWTLNESRLPKEMPKPPKVDGSKKEKTFRRQLNWMTKFTASLDQPEEAEFSRVPHLDEDYNFMFIHENNLSPEDSERIQQKKEALDLKK